MSDTPFAIQPGDTPDLTVLDGAPLDLPVKPSTLGDAYRETIDLQPDTAAQVIKLSRQLGEHPAAVQQNLDSVKKAAGIPPDSYFAALEARYPVTAQHIGDPGIMAATKDDLENLRNHEAIVRKYTLAETLWRKANAGAAGIGSVIAKAPATLYDLAATPQNLFMKAINRPDLEVQSPDWLRKNPLARIYDEQVKLWDPPELHKDLVAQLKHGDWAGAGETLAGDFAENAPSLALLMMTGGATGIAAMGEMGASSALDRNRATGVDPAMSGLNAAYHGVTSAALANWGVLGPLKRWEAKIAESVGRESAKQVITNMVNSLLHSGTTFGLATGSTSLAGDIGDAATGVNPNAMDDSLQRALGATLSGFVQGAAMVSPTAAVQGTMRAIDLRRVEQARQVYMAMGETAEASKLRSRLPDSHKEYIQNVTKGTPTEHVYIPAAAFETYFQDKNIDPQQLLLNLGVEDQFKDAKETGGDLKIPMSEWTDKIVGTEHWAGLADDVKFNPESLTKRQYDERVAALDAQMQKEADAAANENPQVKEGKDFVYDDVLQKMRQSGAYEKMKNGEKLMDANAKLFAAAITTEARRHGIDDVKSYYLNGMPVDVVKGEMPGESATGTLRQGPLHPVFDEAYQPNPHLDEAASADQERGAQYVRDNLDKILADYEAKNGTYISTDDFRDSLRPAGYNGVNSAAFHEPARALRRIYEAQRMEKARAEGRTKVLITAGGSGAGKTTFLKHPGLDRKQFGAIIDATLSKESDGVAMIEKLRKEGMEPSIAYIYRDPVEAWRGILDRIQAEGRIVPLHEHLSMHQGSAEVIKRLMENPPEGVKISLYKNELNSGLKEMSLEELRQKSYTGIDRRLTDETQQAHQAGRLTEDQLRSILAPRRSPSEDRPLQADHAGAGSGLPGQRNSEAGTADAEQSRLNPSQKPPTGGETLFQSGRSQPTFFSVIQKTIDDKMPAKAPAADVLGILRNTPGVKQEELAWTGLEDWLKEQKGPVTKEQVQEFLRQNDVQIQEVMHGDTTSTPAAHIQTLRERGYEVQWMPDDGQGPAIDAFTKDGETYLAGDNFAGMPQEDLSVASDATEAVADSNVNDTKFSAYTLPGGEHYRELLLTLPSEASDAQLKVQTTHQVLKDYLINEKAFGESRINDYLLLAARGQLSEGQLRAASDDPKQLRLIENLRKAYSERGKTPSEAMFKSGHFDEPNILAHIRFNDRTAYDNGPETGWVIKEREGQKPWGVYEKGASEHAATFATKEEAEAFAKRNQPARAKVAKRVLFIEEVQSDWHQKGREQGYAGEKPSAEAIKAGEEKIDAINKELSRLAKAFDEAGLRNRDALQVEYDNLLIERDAIRKSFEPSGVPDAPFKKTWHELALKRMLRYAAENGYDKLAWTTGDQQAERYDLSKQIDAVHWEAPMGRRDRYVVSAIKDGKEVVPRGSYAADEMAGVVGKELAQKIIDEQASGKLGGQFSGLDLKVGGEGMKGFYDQMIPSFLNKYAKKWGGRVGETELKADVIPPGNRGAREQRIDAHSLDITPSMKESVMQGQPLFQGDPETDPRGFIQFTPNKTVIGLIKADASTFPHELAHYWLNNFHAFVRSGAAKEGHLADWKILSNWLKVKDDQEALSRDQQEKFARGFEAYLREGKAPSEGLRAVFAKFRRWLTRLYKDPIALGVDMNQDVRQVMDRMLATDDEISFARQQAGMDTEVQIPGLDPAVQAKLSKLRQDAHEQAVDELLKKQMKELTSERRDLIARETAKATEAAEEEVTALPEQQATEALQRGFKRDGRDVAQRFIERKLDKEERTSFRMIAELQGYSSADEMAQKILDGKSFKDEVAARVADKMKPFADMRDTGKIRTAAWEAVHNEKQTELLANERAIFQQLVDQAQNNAQGARMRREEARIDALIAKRKAVEIIARTPLRDAGRFMQYFTAERRAALDAQQAAADGKFQVAADAKRRQMLNHALAQASFHARRQIERWTSYLKDVQGKSTELFKAEEHFNQVAAILQRFGAGRDDFHVETKTETLQEWSDRMTDQNEAIAIAPWLMDESLSKPFADLSFDQAHDVVNALKNIQRVANAQFNFYKIMGGARVQDVVLDLTKEAAQYNKAAEPEKIMRREQTMLERAKKWIRGYDSNLRTIENVALQLGGWNDNTLWVKALWEPVQRAAAAESDLMKPLNARLEALLTKHYGKEEREALLDYDEARFIPELGQSVRQIELLMMGLNTGNASNRARLFDTPIVGAEKVPWDEEAVMGMLQRNLTANDWRFIQGTWDLINSLWPESSQNHKEITGFTPEKVAATPFTVSTADAQTVEMAGGYFPLKSDMRANLRTELREKLDDPLYTERNPAWRAATKTGHLESRQAGAKYPVALDSSIIQRHLRDTVHDIAFRATVIDLRRLVGNQQFADAVKTYAGAEQYQALRDWVGSAANGNVREGAALTFWEQISKAVRSKYSAAVLMFNPKIVTQNLSNIFLYAGAAEGFDWNDVAHGFYSKGVLDFIPASLTRSPRADLIREMVYGKSAFMRDKKNSPDYSIQETFNRLTGKNNKMSDWFYGYFGAADELTSIPMWLTAFEKAQSLGKPEADAIAFADTVIRRSIGGARKYETAPIFRGSELDKTFATFQGFMNAQQNRWERERGILAKDYFGNASRFSGYIAAHFVLFAAASNILSGNLPDFTDEDKMKKWMKSLLLYKFQMMPGVNAISSVVADQALGIPSFGYRPVPQAAVIEKAIEAVKAGIGFSRGNVEGKDLAETASHAAAFATGTPDQFMQLFWNVYDYWAEGMTPQPGDVLRRRPTSER